jgi:hypothetical protein
MVTVPSNHYGAGAIASTMGFVFIYRDGCRESDSLYCQIRIPRLGQQWQRSLRQVFDAIDAR